ncbi:MAG: alpha/beta hydrolase fold domain-containing protein, partial [Bacteroidota bacterium]
LLLSACENTEAILPPETALVELEFSTSPIDLNGVDARFAQDQAYDQYTETRFDVFLPESASPTPLVIFIHGGGFTGGNKAFIYTDDYSQEIIELLDRGIAVASINYRLLKSGNQEGVLMSLNDSRRAVQYLRYIHKELNIDKEKVALFGSSAGGATSLWIATNDDFKDESNSDPVLRESSRVSAIALRATQSSLDIEGRWLNDVFVDFSSSLEEITTAFKEETIFNFYGIDSWEAYESPEIEAYRTKVDMLSLISSDDPEIWVSNTGGHNNKPETTSSFNHHPFHAREIKEYADAAGVPNVTTYGKPILYQDSATEGFVEFFLRKLER